MDINRFLSKPVEVEMFGEIIPIRPLTTKFYPLLVKSQRIEMEILSKSKKGETISDDQYTAKANIDQEIAYSVMSDIFPELTRIQFDNEIPVEIIYKIMNGVLKASGITDEQLIEATNKLNKISGKNNDNKNTETGKKQ